MASITINQLSPSLSESLTQRAIKNGRTVEDEITAILQSVLLPELSVESDQNLSVAIEKHFIHLGDFELPKIIREPIRNPLIF